MSLSRRLITFICLALAGALTAQETPPTVSRLAAHAEALTAAPHRLSGTPEFDQAASYVRDQLAAILPADRILEQPFRSVQTSLQRCELTTAQGTTLPLQPMRPNGLMPAYTTPDGIAGPLLYGGDGSLSAYGNQSPDGAIVVLEYNSNDGWLTAFRLGARAVIILASDAAEAWHAHHTTANVNLPRYYFEGGVAELPIGQPVTIRSQIRWLPTQGRNVVAWFPGSDPTFLLGQPETLIVAVNLDSFGSVPRRSPAAREAANAAALLELARYLADNPPRRNVLLAFLDNEARAHRGATVLYRALDTAESDVSIAVREANLLAERDFLGRLRDQLQSSTPLTIEAPTFKEIRRRITPTAAQHVFALTHELTLLRIALKEAPEESPEAEALLAEIERIEDEKNDWNNVRRAIGKLHFAPEAIYEMLRSRSATEVLPEDEIAALSPERQAEQVELRKTLEAATARTVDNLAIAIDEVLAVVTSRLDELGLEMANLEADKQLLDWAGGHHYPLHISLMLGDGSSSWGAIVGGDSVSRSRRDVAGLYQRVLAAINAASDTVSGAPLRHFLSASVDGTVPQTRALWAAPFLTHSGEIAGNLQIYNLAFGTVQDSLPRAGTPVDTLANLDIDRVAAQADEAIRLVAALGDTQDLSQRYSIERSARYVYGDFSGGRFHGASAMAKSRGSSMPSTPVANAIVRIERFTPPALAKLSYEPVKPYGFDNFKIISTNQEGIYTFGPFGHHEFDTSAVAVYFDEAGIPFYGSVSASKRKSHERINMVVCRTGGLVLPLQLTPGIAKVMGGETNSGIVDSEGLTETVDSLVYWFVEEDVRAIKIFQLNATVALVNGSANLGELQSAADADVAEHAREGVGIGMPMLPRWEFPTTSARAATDLWRLNEARLEVLRERGISNSSLEELHGRAEDLLLAGAAAESLHRKEASASSAFLSQRPVYTQVRQTLDDLVKAVLVLLALAVPFAFAAERLLIGAPTVYKQIGWFVVFFLIPFFILYFSHPAFAISKTPVVIFLGFTIIILASLVIFIIMRKFEVELKIIQGMESTVHAADVSRFGTIIAAMNMGISSMRRRPLRTALTAVTILLLTFTILCFASFGQQLGIIKIFLGPNPGYAAVNLHQVTWGPLPEPLLETIDGRWGEQVQLSPRYWVSPSDNLSPLPVVSRDDAGSPVLLRGLLGLTDEELAARPDLARIIERPAEVAEGPAIWLTAAVAQRLGATPGTPLIINGQRVRLAGILDPVQLSTLKDLDGSDIIPVDFTEVTSEQQGGGSAAAAQVASDQNWATLPVDSVAIVDAHTARRAGAALHALNLYLPGTADAAAVAEDLARMLPFPVSATRSEGVYRHVLGTQIQASGARDLVFPIILGGLVIFGTMLGSVADREKEIYTFSALGLAPQHVAGLFFAEALVYSVLGGLGGYLLAQGSLSALGVLADYGYIRVPEMNYSSTNAIITILLVMTTVLISAIYPAIKASKSANPGVMRNWKLPQPDGDIFNIVFPFTVSGYDITGVVSFLKEHFDTFSDAGIGRFISRDAQLVKHESGQVGVHTFLALAPFDLGVTQDFELTSAPSEIKGIDEINIRLTRRSGQPKDWVRLNKSLLEDLRRQFLIWRSLPQETMEEYRGRTLSILGATVAAGTAATPANEQPDPPSHGED